MTGKNRFLLHSASSGKVNNVPKTLISGPIPAVIIPIVRLFGRKLTLNGDRPNVAYFNRSDFSFLADGLFGNAERPERFGVAGRR